MLKSNFYSKERKLILNEINLEPIIRELENEFQNKDTESLGSLEDALNWYDMLLNNAGDIAANFIAPRAAEVDEVGAELIDGDVHLAPGTKENMETLAKSGYMGGTLDRRYGGLNLPVTINNIIVEMVSQADASLMNLFGLQDIAVTIQHFGNEDQKSRFLPLFAKGKISGAMTLTEPDAGSDLQAVKLKAIEKDGKFYLDGVKRFITNGCADVHLVLARSEAGSTDGRGLSMMLYQRDKNMIIRRIENKLGIHGSPTAELQFNMAECELVGKRRFGLIKYMISLLNGARLATSSQAMGIAQAAYEEAVRYANEREQFGKKIIHFPAVFQMLKKMQAEIETSRVLLYHTALAVDYENMYTRMANKGENVREKQKWASWLADFLTPLSKYTITEMANKAAYDALQVHGGCGYMKDFPVERLARDARITNIYEGTTQLQVVAAIVSITSNQFAHEMEKLHEVEVTALKVQKEEIIALYSRMDDVVKGIVKFNNKDLLDYTATYMVEMASIIYRLYLFLPLAEKYEDKRDIFNFFLMESKSRMNYLVELSNNTKETYGANITALKSDFVK